MKFFFAGNFIIIFQRDVLSRRVLVITHKQRERENEEERADAWCPACCSPRIATCVRCCCFCDWCKRSWIISVGFNQTRSEILLTRAQAVAAAAAASAVVAAIAAAAAAAAAVAAAIVADAAAVGAAVDFRQT